MRRVVKTAIAAALLSAGLFFAAQAELKTGVTAALAPAPGLVAADINAKGGLGVGGKKYQIEVIAYDDQYKAAEAALERAQRDVKPMMTRIIGLKADLIEPGGISPATAGLIVRQARQLGYKGLFGRTGGAGPRGRGQGGSRSPVACRDRRHRREPKLR